MLFHFFMKESSFSFNGSHATFDLLTNIDMILKISPSPFIRKCIEHLDHLGLHVGLIHKSVTPSVTSLQVQQCAATSIFRQSPVDTQPLSEYRPMCRAFQLPPRTSVPPFSNSPSPHPHYVRSWRHPAQGSEPQSSYLPGK